MRICFWLSLLLGFPSSFVINVRRLRMASSCVVVGQLASQYGMLVGFSLVGEFLIIDT